MTYQKWIALYECEYDLDVTDLCCEATLEMWEHFPELRRVRGKVIGDHCLRGAGAHRHWWCLDPDGRIVDPTASQFHHIVEYVQMDRWPNDPPNDGIADHPRDGQDTCPSEERPCGEP